YLLKQQLIAEADEKNAHAIETVTVLLREIGPLIPEVKRKLRVDLVATAEQLKTAVEEQKWPQALAKARLIDNVIKSDDWVRGDLRRLRRHSLAYAVLNFSPAVCREARMSGDSGDSTDRVPVRFTAAPRERQFPELAGVRDLNISDFDLDGAADVIALTESQLTVLKRTAASGPWQKSISVTLERPMRGLLVADLDRDFQAKSKPAAAPAGPEKTVDDADHGKPSYQPADVEVVTF